MGEREHVCMHTYVCVQVMYVCVCCRQDVEHAWCCATLEHPSTNPAKPADSAVPSAAQTQPSCSAPMSSSGNTDRRARETVPLCAFPVSFLAAAPRHLCYYCCYYCCYSPQRGPITDKMLDKELSVAFLCHDLMARSASVSQQLK